MPITPLGAARFILHPPCVLRELTSAPRLTRLSFNVIVRLRKQRLDVDDVIVARRSELFGGRNHLYA